MYATSAETELGDSRNLDIVLSAALRDSGSIHDPLAYVDFVRGCIEPAGHFVTELKSDGQADDKASKRFRIFLEVLRAGLPPVEFSVATELALIADRTREETGSRLPEGWLADLGLADLGINFSRSSSGGKKGRILFNLVRFLRSNNCLELGTAYGMSALFILSALNAYTNSGHLTTVEGDGNLFLVSSPLLQSRYGKRVRCCKGRVQDMLAELVQSMDPIDFLFHDCGHSREAYTRDFGNVVEKLTPGAVVLFDDIRWEDNWSLSKSASQTYEGWQEVASHPRVRRAVEIDGELGLLLIG